MLQLRPNCECCDRDLPPDAIDAVGRSFECTFCRDDAPSAHQPQAEIFVAHAAPWDSMLEGATKFDNYPPSS